MIRGSCLCRGVQFEIRGEVSGMTDCHCSMCRKAHGASFVTFVSSSRDDFRWVQGEDLITVYNASAAFGRPFCRVCGSTLGGMSHGRVGSITLGTVDGDPGVRPLSHIFVGSKAIWHEIEDDLPQFEEWPPGEEWT